MEGVLVRGQQFLAHRLCLNIASTRFLKPFTLSTVKRKMSSQDDWKSKKTLYEFSATDIDGNQV